MRKSILFVTLLLGFCALYGQSSKTIRTYGISKKTETVVIYHDGLEVSRYVEEIEHYNAEGDWIEKFIFTSGGEVKLHQKRVYQDNEIIDETTVDLNGSGMKEAEAPSFERTQYTYTKGDIIKETKVSEEGDVIEQKELVYNKLGDLVEVSESDGNGVLVRRELTEYNDKGLKVKERVVDSAGVIVKEKLFAYE